MKRAAVYVINFFMLMHGSDISAQLNQRVSLIPEQSEVKILGSSNISDWEEKVEHFNISLDLSYQENKVSEIHKIKASFQTRSIKSDLKRMSKKTHLVLQEKEFPNIEYRFTSMVQFSSKKGQFSGTAEGNLTIAGITRPVHVPFTGMINGNKITLTGSADLNLNAFHIKAPSAMLGIIKVNKDVTVSFKLLFLLER